MLVSLTTPSTISREKLSSKVVGVLKAPGVISRGLISSAGESDFVHVSNVQLVMRSYVHSEMICSGHGVHTVPCGVHVHAQHTAWSNHFCLYVKNAIVMV